jgi:hypothetical protein
MARFTEKKSAACCGRIVAHKTDGDPYKHTCVEPTAQQREATRAMDAAIVASYAAEQADECDHPNGFELGRCAGCGASAPDDDALLADPDTCTHAFTWADDGNGHEGSFCIRCGTEDSGDLKAERAAAGRAATPQQTASERSEADEFLDPTEPKPELNVSGQPKARYAWRGKTNMGYMVKLPETGDFRRYKNGSVKGLTRCTTFNKAASDQNALSDWGKRNVLIGASLRPDLVARAHGLTHVDNRSELMSLVSELETAAGAKVSADIGTMIHEITERLDGDPSYKITDVPAQFREAAVLYRTTLLAHGLRPVQGLIERTTYVPDFGGVVGTLDRVYYHEKSGQYLIGDVKTGKTLEYGMDEIETQEAIYARGVNGAGVYDWNTDTWCPPGSYGDSVGTGPWHVPTVSEDWGIVIHMPVQGDDAGKCLLVRADLQRGWRHAKVCHDVRVERANKPKPVPWDGSKLLPVPQTPVQDYSEEPQTQTVLERPDPQGPCSYGCHTDGLNYRECPVHGEPGYSVQPAPRPTSDEVWLKKFQAVQTQKEAAALWQKAKDAGVAADDLARYVDVAKQRLDEIHHGRLWDAEFSGVQDTDAAGRLWSEAKAAGVEPMELQRLVQLAQQRLRELGVTG